MLVSCPGLRRSWFFRRLLVRAPQLSVKARLAHSAGFAAVALHEVIAAGRAVELRVGHRMAVRDGGHFGPTLGTLLTDESVTPDAESSHSPPHQAGRAGGDAGDCHARLEFAWTSLLSHNLILYASSRF